MEVIYFFDKQKNLTEWKYIEEGEIIPPNATKIAPADGLYKAQFIDGEWIEATTKEEMEQIKKEQVPPVPTDVRINDVELENAALWFESMQKDATISTLEKDTADIYFTIMAGGVK